jgi:hypothetical protein
MSVSGAGLVRGVVATLRIVLTKSSFAHPSYCKMEYDHVHYLTEAGLLEDIGGRVFLNQGPPPPPPLAASPCIITPNITRSPLE